MNNQNNQRVKNGDIRTLTPEWTKVMDGLLVVDLTIKRKRFRTKADWSEYGLDGDEFEAYTSGSRQLLPPHIRKELDMLERMARKLLEDNSYDTAFGRMMPKEKYDEFKNLLYDTPLTEVRRLVHSKNPPAGRKAIWDETSLIDRWNWLGEEIAANRDAIVDEMIEAYRPSAIVRWRLETGLPLDSDIMPSDAWLDKMLKSMAEKIPTAEEISDSFVITITPAFVEGRKM